jgi:hypothetical protein
MPAVTPFTTAAGASAQQRRGNGHVGVRELGRPIVEVIGLVAVISVLFGARWIAFSVQDIGTVSISARSVGDDGLWLSYRLPFGLGVPVTPACERPLTNA